MALVFGIVINLRMLMTSADGDKECCTPSRMPRGALQGGLCPIGRRMIIVGHVRCQVIEGSEIEYPSAVARSMVTIATAPRRSYSRHLSLIPDDVPEVARAMPR